MFEMKSRFCVAASILSICQQLSTPVTATKSSLIRSNRVLADGSVSFDPINTLGGPYPNGWVNSTNVDDQANLAYDLGVMYEVEDSDGKNEVYKNGIKADQPITLQGLGLVDMFRIHAPLYNYYAYALKEFGQREGEMEDFFDGQPAENYADTIVRDLFGLESVTTHVSGLEKEAVIVTGLWMSCYAHTHEVLRLCRDAGSSTNTDELLGHLDKAVALWIGRMQVHGDNSRGTMLYNLAERAGMNFGQDHGEVPVNRKLMDSWQSIKDQIQEGVCAQDKEENPDKHKALYDEMNNVVRLMNIPLIQNLIHYITIGAEKKIIELYALVIFPQLISCDLSYIDLSFAELRKMSSTSDGEDLMSTISNIRKMYSCLGVTCNDIGAHSSGSSCVDDEVDPVTSIAAYQPKSDVRRLLKFDRDVNQIRILIEEGNKYSAFDLYKYGRNSNILSDESSQNNDDFISVRSMALHEGLEDNSNDRKRLHKMYEDFYPDGSDFANNLVSDQILHGSYPNQTLPDLIQTIVAPQYAMRAFFAAYDSCESNKTVAVELWDKGVAALVGSIEGESALGNDDHHGVSWFALGTTYCHMFRCGDGDFEDPSFRKKMMNNVKFGRDYIRSGRCSAVHNKIVTMESLLLVPIVQGLMYHTFELSRTGSLLEYAHVFAFGRAVLPILSVANKRDATVIEESLSDQNFAFDASHTKKIWIAVTLAIPGFGIDCTDVGIDTFGVLEKDASFCTLSADITDFPTPAPQPTISPQPTDAPKTLEPSAMPTPSDQIRNNEIHPTFAAFFSPGNLDDATQTARIALDLREIKSKRSDIEADRLEAHSIYTTATNSNVSLQQLSQFSTAEQLNNPLYNFYRHAFKRSDLFNYSTESVDNYADIVITDAFTNGEDVDLASEAIIVLTLFMKISHDLSSAVTKLRDGDSGGAVDDIESAFALYVGVGQSEGDNDGHLFYSFAQRVGWTYEGYVENSSEVEVNSNIRRLFEEARNMAMIDDEGNATDTTDALVIDLRKQVGLIISMMNLSLVRQFLHLLEENAHATEQTNYLELLGLAVLPQIETCQPSNHEFLTKEITDNGLNLDPAKTGSLVSAFQKSFHCFGLTCEEVYSGNNLYCSGLKEVNTYVGFSTDNSVALNAQSDIAVLKIAALVSEGANEEALEFYEVGGMVPVTESPSLKQLLIEQSSVTQELFTKYFDHSGDVNGLITDLIVGDTFTQFSATERAEALVKVFQTMVFVQASMSSLVVAAHEDCSVGSFDHWHQAVAYLTGSIEGEDFGGDIGNHGVSIYGLAKEMCDSFSVCAGSIDSDVNKYLLATLSKGKDLISTNSCVELTNYVEKRVMPLILVPLIQATIKYADTSQTALFHVVGRAIYPFLHAVSSHAASSILEGSDVSNSVQLDGQSTMIVFNETLASLWVDCTDVGYSEHLQQSMCDVINSKQEQSYSLSDGLYITSTYVESSAKIAEDIEYIETALRRGNVEQAKGYYQDGLFSDIYDQKGKRVGLQSIQNFSIENSTDMVFEPIFNLYQYCLKDVTRFSNNPGVYADTITSLFFDDGIFANNDPTIAVESAVALNIWGMIVHLLYDTIWKCERDDFTYKSEGVHNIDKAVALWIGSNQVTGDETKGFLLYRLAEEAGTRFGTEFHDSQAKVNRNVLRLFKELALQLSSSGACYSGNSFITVQLRYIVDKLISQMSVPLIQNLIYNLNQNDEGRVLLYSHAVIPLVAACDKSTYEYLHKKLISGAHKRSEVDDIIVALQSTYSCLDLKCADIGYIEGMPECSNRGEFESFGGYTPISDVREYLDIDLDIRFIEIMLEQKATNAAKDIYLHGKHAVIMTDKQKEPMSLRSLATSTKRRQYVPSFFKFSSYFRGNDNYIHDEIMKLFDHDFMGSDEQHKVMIVKTLQYQVTFMAVLQRVYEAIAYCKSGQQAQTLRALPTWDSAAALMIGSMKKSDGMGAVNQSNGYLLFSSAKDFCPDFNTCSLLSMEAKSNLKILDGLYSGSFELEQNSCSSVESVGELIESQLLVPMIQGTLRAAFMNSQPDFDRNTDTSFAAGYVYSRAILPYFDSKDSRAQAIIAYNLNFQFDPDEKPVKDGYGRVFESVADVLEDLDLTLTCNDIGFMNEANKGVCKASRSTSGSSSMKSSFFIAVAALIPILVFAF